MPVGIGKESGCKQASYEERNCNDKLKPDRRRWILHRISSIRAFGYYVTSYAKTLTKSTMRQKGGYCNDRANGMRRLCVSVRPIWLAKNMSPSPITDCRCRPLRRNYVCFSHDTKTPSSLDVNGRKKRKKNILVANANGLLTFIDFKTPRGNIRRLCNFLALVTPQLKITPILPRQRRIDATVVHYLR